VCAPGNRSLRVYSPAASATAEEPPVAETVTPAIGLSPAALTRPLIEEVESVPTKSWSAASGGTVTSRLAGDKL